MAKHLKDKTDAECRQLASHYYSRATKAERRAAEAEKKLSELTLEYVRVLGLAHEMTDPT